MSMDLIKNLNRLLAPLQRRVMLMVGRCVLVAIDDNKGIQLHKSNILKGETRTGMEHVQNYGFTHHPIPGAEGVVVFNGGNRDHGYVIACDDRRYRIKGLAEGEVAIYTDEGDKIHFKRGRVTNIVTETLIVDAGTKVEINTPLMETNAPDIVENATTIQQNASATVDINTPLVDASSVLSTGGDIEGGAEITAENNIRAKDNVIDFYTKPNEGNVQGIRDIYNIHDHNENDTAPSPTNVPNQLM